MQQLVTEGGYDPIDGVAVTIEALKEMGVVIEGRVRLYESEIWGDQWTIFRADGLHGKDGKALAIIVSLKEEGACKPT